jgi:predicted amino acid-binding ACT domain protein
MRLWQFSRLHGNKIKIDEELGQALGLVNGSQVFSAMFRYDHNGSTSYELVLSTFGPENYRQLCQLTIQMIDQPGACAQAAKFLSDRNVDILNSVSLSNISGVSMTWKMLADLSYYGEPSDLKADFDALKKARSSSLELVDTLDIQVSHIADRYTKGAAYGSRTVKTKPIKRKHKASTIIANDEFEVPQEFLDEVEGLKDGQPLMMVGDMESYVLSVTLLEPQAKLVRASLVIPDKPGAIARVAEVMQKNGINMISLESEVLVFYESMTLDIIADVSAAGIDTEKLRSALEETLTMEKGRYFVDQLESIEF